tara:strand:+ start:7295 stop:7759 length:465 start_codon:yes stop_codon:yes gene_type:complete
LENEKQDLSLLYTPLILEHSKNPKNNVVLDSADISGSAVNPFCGDEISIQIQTEKDKISSVGIEATGCFLNIASSSIVSQAILGLTVTNINEFIKQYRLMIQRQSGNSNDIVILKNLEDDIRKSLDEISKVRDFPIRIKCTLLVTMALQNIKMN